MVESALALWKFCPLIRGDCIDIRNVNGAKILNKVLAEEVPCGRAELRPLVGILSSFAVSRRNE